MPWPSWSTRALFQPNGHCIAQFMASSQKFLTLHKLKSHFKNVKRRVRGNARPYGPLSAAVQRFRSRWPGPGPAFKSWQSEQTVTVATQIQCQDATKTTIRTKCCGLRCTRCTKFYSVVQHQYNIWLHVAQHLTICCITEWNTALFAQNVVTILHYAYNFVLFLQCSAKLYA